MATVVASKVSNIILCKETCSNPHLVMAKDKNMGHVLKAQVLLYPLVSLLDSTKHPSCQKYRQGDLSLSMKMTEFSASMYLSITKFRKMQTLCSTNFSYTRTT